MNKYAEIVEVCQGKKRQQCLQSTRNIIGVL